MRALLYRNGVALDTLKCLNSRWLTQLLLKLAGDVKPNCLYVYSGVHIGAFVHVPKLNFNTNNSHRITLHQTIINTPQHNKNIHILQININGTTIKHE